MVFEEKTLKSELLFQGRIINLRRDTVTVLNGTSEREIVEHNGGAVIGTITDDGNLIMVKQFRKPLDKVVLEVPAGKRDGDEAPIDVAKRELKEETGYTAKEMIHLTTMHTSPGYSTEALDIFLAKGLIPGETDFDENEAIDIYEYPLNELVDMAMRGEIDDGKTLVTVLMVKEYLEREKR